VINVLRCARAEEWLQQRILEDMTVEGVLKSMKCFFATGEFVERRHG
jgi:hypothetical protein